MKKILYINKQYRTYDYCIYETLANSFKLIVIWISDFKINESLPEYLRKSIFYKILGYKGARIKPWSFVYNIKLLKLIYKYSNDSDIIISSTSDIWFSKIAFFVAKMKKKRIGFRKESWFDNNGLIWKSAYDSLTKFIEKKADYMFYIGRLQKDYLLSRGIAKYKLMPFYYLIDDMKAYPTNINLLNNLKKEIGDKIVFLYIGRIIPRKGLDLLIRVFSKIESVFDNVFLLIVGGPSKGGYYNEKSEEYYNHCLNLIKEMNISHIKFIGDVNPLHVNNFYYISDVFVLPHRKFIEKREQKQLTGEGWGNVIVEAASMGKPLIASDRVASAYDLMIPFVNGILINSEKLENELYQAMTYILNNKSIIKKYSLKSRVLFKKFNNPKRIIDSVNYAIDFK